MIKGDHIFVYCQGYSHHGIYCGGDQVIHFDFDPTRKVVATLLRLDLSRICKTSVDQFSGGREIHVRGYDDCDLADVVVQRAKQRIDASGYSLFGNNCEHFAVWCKTGQAESSQVSAASKASKPLQAGIAAAFLLRRARFLPPQLRVAAYALALGASTGAAIRRYYRQRTEDVASKKS